MDLKIFPRQLRLEIFASGKVVSMRSVAPLSPTFAAEIEGLDLTQPLDDQIGNAVAQAFEAHPVLIFPKQDIDDDRQIAFSEVFDVLETTKPGTVGTGSKVVVLSNFDSDGNIVLDEERAALPPVRRLWCWITARGGAFYIGPHCVEIEGMPFDKSHALTDELTEFPTQERFIYRHHRLQHDVIMWDNRVTVHRASPFTSTTEKRHMVRTTINGDTPTLTNAA